jgi:hypothetical protein
MAVAVGLPAGGATGGVTAGDPATDMVTTIPGAIMAGDLIPTADTDTIMAEDTDGIRAPVNFEEGRPLDAFDAGAGSRSSASAVV